MRAGEEFQYILTRMSRLRPGDILHLEGVEIRRTIFLHLWTVGLPHQQPVSQHRKIKVAAHHARRLINRLRKCRRTLGFSETYHPHHPRRTTP